MFLRATNRKKDGKEHRYFSIVENQRVSSTKTVQRTILYLGEINDKQQAEWRKTLAAFDQDTGQPVNLSLFPDDRPLPGGALDGIQVCLGRMELRRPRPFGDCWLANELWLQLGLDRFWSERLPEGREAVAWEKVLRLLVVNRLIEPGSEFRVHRHWFVESAMDTLLEENFEVAAKDRLYRCLDRLLEHKQDLFVWLKHKWAELFAADFEVLLYDLTSTYFEGDAGENPKAQRGYSRDSRPDCPQVVIALVVTTDGFPLAYEVMPGNTSEQKTLRLFLDRIESQFGKARRVWLMDRGIPTEATLKHMRERDPMVSYLVGTPRGRVSQHESKWLDLEWRQVRDSVQVKLYEHDGDVYVLARSQGRQAKESAIRRKRLARLLRKLRAMRRRPPSRDRLLQRIGAARKEAGRAFGFVKIDLPGDGEAVTKDTFRFRVDKEKLRRAEERDGQYLLRTNLPDGNPEDLWNKYVLLVEIEAAFRALKTDLGLRPVYHRLERRVDAHILVAFLAYCLQITLKNRLMIHAPGLSPRAVLEKLATVQMIDVCIPTVDGRMLTLPRYTQPAKDLELLMEHIRLALPPQPPPRIGALPTLASNR